MQVFRRLSSIAAISFDLDDTLYDNRPVIQAAEAAQLALLQREYAASRCWGKAEWRQHKIALLAQHPQLSHDPTALRLATLKSGLHQLGYDPAKAAEGAAQALAEFMHQRSNFQVPEKSLALLKRLATRFTLIGLSNGNVDPTRIGLDKHLAFVIQAGNGLKMKPHEDLFFLACQRLAIAPSALLHVGDSHSADVAGAIKAGCMAALLNPAFGQSTSLPLESPLPHLQLQDLQSLALLL